MKFFLIAFAVIAAVAADVSHLPTNEYLPPVQESVAAPTNEYLPPVQQYQAAPVQQQAAPVQQVVEAAPAHQLADDGYRYKTHRRVVYRRNRRGAPSNEYLPPVQEAVAVQEAAPVQQPAPVQYSAPVQQQESYVEAAPAHELADDGYRYKTHRRVVYRRNRRGAPSNEYLPPVQESAPVQEAAPVQEVAYAVEEAAPAHELADDGYRYKTHRRVVYRRNRRGAPSNEYLPPVQESAPVQEAAPVQEVAYAVEEAAPAHELADDGYRYKTHRRVVYRRNRRGAPSNEYLPPVQESQSYAPVEEVPVVVNVVEEAAPAHELADDGYRYKTHRRVVYRRNRRDVSHLPSNEYLPPTQQQSAPVAAPTNEYLPPVQQQAAPVQQYVAPAPQPAPVQQYVAPAPQPAPVQYSAPVQQQQSYVEPAPAHELAADGYRYKTHRRVVYRRH